MSSKTFKELAISSSFNQLKRVEAYLLELKKWAEIDEEPFNNIQLAATEAVTNAVIHGNKEDRSKKVKIKTQMNEKEMEITVTDEGSGFDPSTLPDPRSEEQLLKESGRGIFLIKQYSDEAYFEQNGTQVRMIFYL